MNTLTKLKQPSKNKERQQGQNKRPQQQPTCNQTQPTANLQPQEEEGLYELVKQDEQLRAYHVAKLQSTYGYEQLSEVEAGDMVAQMLKLSTLMFELLVEGEAKPRVQHKQEFEESNQTHGLKSKRSR